MKRTHIALAASTLLLLTACSGTGGASHDGEVYLGAPSSGPTVQQIMELADSGDVEAIVNLITKSTAAAAGGVEPDPSPVTFQADELGIPMGAGFTVDILMTVTDDSGTSTKTFTSSVADDGSISFDIPPVVTGSEVSIRMDVRDDSGMLVQTGRAKKTVSGDSDTLELTLSTNFRIPLTPPAGVDAWVWLFNEDPSDPTDWTACTGDSPEYSISVNKEGSTVRLGGLAVKDGVVYEMPIQDIIVGSDETVSFTMDTTKNFPACNTLYATTNGVLGGSREWIDCLTTDTDKKPALFDRADPVLEVSPGPPTGETNSLKTFLYSSDGVSWGNAFVWPGGGNPWQAQMNGVISPGFRMKMHYLVKVAGIVVGEGDITGVAP